MLARLTHRGPDDSDSLQVGDVWLGHTRLSIVDVATGRQPLSTQAGDFHMVGNGEVYNHADLRPEFTHRTFATRSDNEVVLHLVDEHGPSALARLRGMYAFVLAGADGRLIAARDPVGIKPLYWAQRDGRRVFASELKAFPADWRADVEAFPPGHYWTPEQGLVRFSSVERGLEVEGFDGLTELATGPDGLPSGAEWEQVLATVREYLILGVERRMMADVPVGVFLSGGLDSSLIAAIAVRSAHAAGKDLHSFAVGVEGSPDLAAARSVAGHLGTIHHERVYTADEAYAALPDVVASIESFEPSLVRSAVPNYLLAELAAEHVKVVLTGEGADEIFAGYEYLSAIDDPGALHKELVRTIEGLHNLNLQRCDRVTMAHGLEARVPFLDLDVIGLGLALPPAWKLSAAGHMEKHLLRMAFDGWVPDDVLWRKKSQFGDGSGATGVLQERAAATVTDDDLALEQHRCHPAPRTHEEVAYLRMFREALDGINLERLLGRFATA
jgi:asparagine synthase (glutamine-hydrolysing)